MHQCCTAVICHNISNARTFLNEANKTTYGFYTAIHQMKACAHSLPHREGATYKIVAVETRKCHHAERQCFNTRISKAGIMTLLPQQWVWH